jgi:hypothetical protein
LECKGSETAESRQELGLSTDEVESYSLLNNTVKGKAVKAHKVVTRRGSPHFLDNRLTDGGEVVNLTPRPPFTPRKIPGTHFC